METQLKKIEDIVDIAITSNVPMGDAREKYKRTKQIESFQKMLNGDYEDVEDLIGHARVEAINDFMQIGKIDRKAGQQLLEIESLQVEHAMTLSEAERLFDQRRISKGLDTTGDAARRKIAWRTMARYDRDFERGRRIDDAVNSRGAISLEEAEKAIDSEDRSSRLAKKIIKAYLNDENTKVRVSDWIRGEPNDAPYIPSSVRSNLNLDSDGQLEQERLFREKGISAYQTRFVETEKDWRKRIGRLRDCLRKIRQNDRLRSAPEERDIYQSPAGDFTAARVDKHSRLELDSNHLDNDSQPPAKRQRLDERSRARESRSL